MKTWCNVKDRQDRRRSGLMVRKGFVGGAVREECRTAMVVIGGGGGVAVVVV
jgi:hypothetical protein